jgi:hypothetical protein
MAMWYNRSVAWARFLRASPKTHVLRAVLLTPFPKSVHPPPLPFDKKVTFITLLESTLVKVYQNKGLQLPWNEHLQKTRGEGVIMLNQILVALLPTLATLRASRVRLRICRLTTRREVQRSWNIREGYFDLMREVLARWR